MRSKKIIATVKIVIGIIASVLGALIIYESYQILSGVGAIFGGIYRDQGSKGAAMGIFLLTGGLIFAATSSSSGGGIVASILTLISAGTGVSVLTQNLDDYVFEDLPYIAGISITFGIIVTVITIKQRVDDHESVDFIWPVGMVSNFPRWTFKDAGDDIFIVYSDRIEVIHKETGLKDLTHSFLYSELIKSELKETDSQIILIIYTKTGSITFPFKLGTNKIYTAEKYISKKIQDSSKITVDDPLFNENKDNRYRNTTDGRSIPDEIKRYKELFDEGAISEEEYEQLKQHLFDSL